MGSLTGEQETGMAFLVALIGLMLMNQQAAHNDQTADRPILMSLHHVATAIGATTAAILISNPTSIPIPSLLFGFSSSCLFGYKIVQFIIECRLTKEPWSGVPGLLAVGFGAGAYISIIVIGYLVNFPQA